jgi:hypothetical protein
VRRDGGPPRRVAKLYLPSGSKYFGSREAYALTYTSCQESRKSPGRHLHRVQTHASVTIRLSQLSAAAGTTAEPD